MSKSIFFDIIQNALKEDLGHNGDITSKSIFTNNEKVKFSINSREDMVLCGIVIVEEIFNLNKEFINFTVHKKDGSYINKYTTIIEGEGIALHLMSIERVILNFLQYSSGIASMTRLFVNEVLGTKAKIRSTRKTSPGLRILDKYAVNVGGGESYRNGLDDKIMIKDNHIAGCGNITTAINKIRNNVKNALIAIECDTIAQVEESLYHNVDMILLDNMSVDNISKAVEIINGKAIVEASGGININNVKSISKTGVDYISVGKITNSFSSKDIGLDIVF
ncbi:carboxylating nicotinate-nucleotide diphosphorylase [Neoehrlichia mikurensis]|uniref:Probable nicotinate-nucleotide pyrophosphorylase [carboxylating] n=1 Tax=Neoehrlichia mikurensis TaxID=89586 RepID=A0A9Q9F494_9RICK|nr:carboxylating nicotinate-nucleotide diphosphorylase [Neoehrlichia mikurensis]QXK92324.1 carboxylating nicotinate-nucleotide diphosphorylase [Neoehrlichia mikurensis]QXK92778.1 carboxylating nicotinate-nucleotide diphosphorylase [Neoehrlichia mikurensis]QXK94019.1 carboxylating nicotinate-nucleotide diphosphorylase [Neoehrlichia mikurensis]UTO55817.1 carboxylating nicotinate-nucleotide diphosphorylase [Neoehrlichia mikurensis]UTO56732.1 carboxylating nicotinate-nucleotide diphosphorylase [Ne